MDKCVFFRNALLASLFLASAMTAHADDVDIVGITPGMSVEEVEEAILDYNSELKIDRTQFYMNYSDGVKTHRTEDYVRMVRTAPHRVDRFMVTFAALPDEPKVLAAEREQRIKDAPVALTAYVDALIDKYGEPSLQARDPRSDTLFIQWYLGEDKVNCKPARLQPGPRVGVDVSLQGSIVKEIRNADGSMKLSAAKSIEDCAVVLEYRLKGDPVIKASGAFLDVEAAAENELKVTEWLTELSEKARDELAKNSKSAKPKL